MTRYIIFAYGVICYAVSFAGILYTIGFVGDLVVPKSVGSGPAGSLLPAALINLVLIALFGAQHSVMARPAFKRWLARLMPPAAERSTYILVSSAALLALFALWQPLPQTLWRIELPVLSGALWVLYACGWTLVLLSTFALSHLHFFGLEQVVAHVRRRPSSPPAFRTPLLYRLVRHPLMLGLLIAFWSAPHLTFGRFVFASGMTAYILIGVAYEERDLADALGEDYVAYQQRVPMLVPGVRPSKADREDRQPVAH